MQPEDYHLVILSTIIVIGYGYSTDMPQALQLPLRGQPYNYTSIQFNILYFATYLPIVITDLPLGVILDKYPLQITVIFIAVSSFLAQLFTAILFDFRPEGYMYVVYGMRAIVGVAGQSAFTMQGFILARYAAQNFEMFIGFGLCIPYLFDALNTSLTPLIYDSTHSISLPWYIASGMDFLAVMAALMISRIVHSRKYSIQDNLQQINIFLLCVDSVVRRIEQYGQQRQIQESQFSIWYLWSLPKIFWIINLAIFFNQIILGFYSNLNDLIVNRFQISYVRTGQILLIPFVLGSILSLGFGRILIVRSYLRRSLILLSSLLISFGFLIIYILPNNTNAQQISYFDYFTVILFLILYSLLIGSVYTVLCSTVSLLADKKRLGTAWGVIGVAIGLGESITPLINGLIQNDNDLPDSYRTLSFVYFCTSTIPVALGLIVYFGPYSIIDASFDETHNQKEFE